MTNPTKTQAIKRMLGVSTHRDLAALYTPSMECQVNVAQDGGTKINQDFKGSTWHGWTDGITTWKSFRIPWKANTNPEFTDSVMSYDLAAHVDGIGMTGWDYVNRFSRWIAFDFDAIVGHSNKHDRGLTSDELNSVREKASEVPWITIRRSTSGSGLHLYVFLDPVVPTLNHNEHAALGRSIISKLSGITGFDFENKVDICGQNMWVWHRKMRGTNGLELLKQGVPLSEVPVNWKDHVKVVAGRKTKALPKFAGVDFQDLVGQTNRIPLDDEHTRLIKYLEGTATTWDADYHMLVTHTYHLKKAHNDLTLRGMYDTLSQGTDLDTNNCWMVPLRKGAWVVRRYSKGVQECITWDQDGLGYTRCYLNANPDLPTAARANNGLESPNKSFVFREASSAKATAEVLGAVVPNLPLGLNNKTATLKQQNDGRLLMEIEGDPHGATAGQMEGWLLEKGKWKRMFNVSTKAPVETDNIAYDNIVRHLVTAKGEDHGWMIQSDGSWRHEPLIHIKAGLKSMDISSKEIDSVIGSAVLKAWKIVNRPFTEEFPGDREWNMDAAQFSVLPSVESDDLHYPTWLKVLEHCGKGLNEALKTHPWAQANGVTTGADYLKIWCASLFKEPEQPLPYLFFYSIEQNTGKSTFHESLQLLLTRGYVRADNALTNREGFNGELAGAVVCAIDEKDVAKSKDASNRIKDWVTSPEISIHAKGQTPYLAPNLTHWIQCNNKADACPVFPGDTRITMICVEPIDPLEMIPKKELRPRLMKEAPDFLAALLAVDIPPSNDRLNVPIVSTAEKQQTQERNRSALETFLADKVYAIDGGITSVKDLYAAFSAFCDPDDLQYWTKNMVGRHMPPRFPKGRDKNGEHSYGNLSLNPKTVPDKRLIAWDTGKNYFSLKPYDHEDK